MDGTGGQKTAGERAHFAAPGEAAPAPIETAAPTSGAPMPANIRAKPLVWSRIPADLVPLSGWVAFALPREVVAALVTEQERGSAFLFVPVFMAAGAVVYFAMDTEPGLTAVAASTVLLGAALVLTRGNQIAAALLAALLLVVAGMGLAKFETWRAGTRMLGAEISTVVTARVAAIEHQASGRVRLTLDLISTDRPTLRHAPERIRASARAVPADLAAGSVVSGAARLFPPSGPLRPGSYDFAFEAYFDGVGANGFFLRDPVIVADAAPASSFGKRFEAFVENARLRLAQRIRERIGGAEGEIAAALVAGVRAGIPEAVNEDLRRTGLAHVLSISGLHMALVAATIMGALRLGFALFPDFSSRRPVKKYAAVAALAATAAYLFISGAAVAAERSFIMLAVMQVAVMADRAALTMRNLAIAAIVVIAISPHEVVGPSFQMSFAATAALIGAYGWWSERRRGRRGGSTAERGVVYRTIRIGLLYFAAIAVTSLIAGAATTIYGAWHFQRVSPLSLAANLAAMPIVSVLVMPFAVVAMAALPFGLDGIFFDVMGAGLRAMLAVARWFSERSPLDAVGTVPAGAVLWATVALIIATLTTTRLRLISLPFAALAVLLLAGRTLPLVLVAEDGWLVAVALADGRLAVNRGRPNAFTVSDWQRATASADVLKPTDTEADDAADGAAATGALPDGESGFLCRGEACVARHRSGAVVVHARTTDAALPFCRDAAVIVLENAAAPNPCPPQQAVVILARDLALRGSATVTLSGGAERALVTHPVSMPLRAWHAHRQFSRTARGLPPYQRETAGNAHTPAAPPGADSLSSDDRAKAPAQ